MREAKYHLRRQASPRFRLSLPGMPPSNRKRFWRPGALSDRTRGTEGAYSEFERTSDSGMWARFRFCSSRGSTVAYENEDAPGLVAIPVGALADPDFPRPERSGFERRRHGWVEIVGDNIEHLQDD